ncbi:acyl carrier protein [Clostridium sp. CAG:921]|nr:acyl carrier protein [Clostridium sp. CAG:921]
MKGRLIMKREEIVTKVKEALIDVLGLDEDAKINESDRIIEDLEADSLDYAELVIKLEKTYNVKISDEQLAGKSTVGDIIDFIETII